MRILFAAFGSLGDMHPLIAVALELESRGHTVIIAAMESYREKIETIGFEFRPIRPNFDPDDRELVKKVMDVRTGSAFLLRDVLLPNLRPMYEDLLEAARDVDLMLSGEVVFPARSVAEKLGIKWVSTTLAPGTFLSPTDPFIPPTAMWLRHFRFLGRAFFGPMFGLVKLIIHKWFAPYREFRRELGLPDAGDPMFDGKSRLLNLAMFSRVLGAPQPSWPASTLQTGFCYYDGQKDLGAMPEGVEEFLESGEPPIVFTLGSAAVMDPRDFFTESAKAAKLLGRRALLLYGMFNDLPEIDQTGEWRIETGTGITSKIAAFPYAPYSKVFPRAACVVHQGGVGTTAQVLRAGVAHLIMPYSHDQPDNAARCERLGVAKIVSRGKYSAKIAESKIRPLIEDPDFARNSASTAGVIAGENGAATAADAIEAVLKSQVRRVK